MIQNLLRIIRWPNLLMIAGIQFLIYYKLIDRDNTVLNLPSLIVLSLITLLIGASGYVINDYYDIDIDRRNKPDRQIAGKVWSLPLVKKIYIALVFTGFILSVILALKLGMIKYILIYPLAVSALWLYSYSLKCKPVIGNLWVAFFCAGVIGIVALPDIIRGQSELVNVTFWYYMAFAFITTWYREVIKDIEDRDGDQEAQCKTIVVTFGLMVSRVVAVFLGMVLLASLLCWDSGQAGYLTKLGLNVLEGFTLASMALLWWAKSNSYYRYASTVVKWIMIGGTALLLVPN